MIAFIGQESFPFHITCEMMMPGLSKWAPNDSFVFIEDFDLVIADAMSYNLKKYSETGKRVELCPNRQNHLLLQGEKVDWAKCKSAVLFEGLGQIDTEVDKIFGHPIAHPKYVGWVQPQEYGCVWESCDKFLYLGQKHEILNWTRKTTKNSHKNDFKNYSIAGWFYGKFDDVAVDRYCKDFISRYSIT